METAIVKRAFTCVNSRKHYKVGDEYKADADRIKYLSDKGYVVIATITAHIPKAEVPVPSKAEVAESTTKPKRKRNESK